jgi:hypothetical protein
MKSDPLYGVIIRQIIWLLLTFCAGTRAYIPQHSIQEEESDFVYQPSLLQLHFYLGPMGQQQSSSSKGGAASDQNEAKTDYYELLGLEQNATEDQSVNIKPGIHRTKVLTRHFQLLEQTRNS